jgi:hypothetical protein
MGLEPSPKPVAILFEASPGFQHFSHVYAHGYANPKSQSSLKRVLVSNEEILKAFNELSIMRRNPL